MFYQLFVKKTIKVVFATFQILLNLLNFLKKNTL